MLSKSTHLRSLSQRYAQLCLNRFKQDCRNNSNGVGALLHQTFCTAAEPLKVDDSHTTEAESPELPGWVKPSGKDKPPTKSDDDDFIPPSVSYWIENHKIRVQDIDMKSIVNDIVETDLDKISKVLKNQFDSPDSAVKALEGFDVDMCESLVEQVLRRFSCEWIQALGFFKWAESQKGIKHSPDMYNLMVDNLGKMKKFEIMWGLVEQMKEMEGYITLDTMTKIMRRLAKAGKYEDAIEAFRKIEIFGVDKDVTSLNRLMDALVKQGSVEHAERVYFEFKNHIPPTKQTFNVLVHGWCKTRQIDKAKETIDEMKKYGFAPDSVTYTSFIEAHCREKDFRKVNDTVEEMQKNGFALSIVTYTILMNAYAKAKEIDKAMEIYEQMKKNNCSPDSSFYNVFINSLSKAGRLKDSDAVFEDMSKQGVAPDASTYNTLIYIAAQDLQEEKALSILLKMEENKCKPDIDTYAPLLKMCCRLKRMKVLSFLLRHMFENNVSVDLGTYSLLVSRLSRNGRLDRACSFFEESVMKGFVPMDCTFENLVKELEKKGMEKEKQRVEAAMARAKEQPGLFVH
ncbi:hypothetical protein ACP275_14G019700 [Erythranthe tilingii]